MGNWFDIEVPSDADARRNAAKSLREISDSYMEQGNYDKALEGYRLALERAPELPTYYFLVSKVLSEKLGRSQEAFDILTLAYQHECTNPALNRQAAFDVRVELGFACLQLNLVDTAIDYFTDALLLFDGDSRAFRGLADALVAKGESDDAARAYQRAFALDPENTLVLLHFANLLNSVGRAEEALSYYRQYVKLNRNDASVHRVIGDLLMAKGGVVAAAIKHYKRALVIAPADIASCKALEVAELLAISDASCLGQNDDADDVLADGDGEPIACVAETDEDSSGDEQQRKH